MLRPAETTGFIAGAWLLALAVQPMAVSAPGQPCTDAAQEVTIKDEGLRQAIRRQLKLVAEAVITCKDMQELRDLSAQELNIASLEGLEHATRLETLECARNKIKSLAPLAGLQRLTKVGVDRNLIADLTPILRNTALGHGFEFSIRFNCLDVSDGSSTMKDIDVLRTREIQIRFESNPVEGCAK